MQESQDPKQNTDDKRQFITEKIVKKPHRWRRRILRFLLVIIMAVVFGLAAALTFVIARPWVESLFPAKPQETEAVVTIPQDVPSEPAAVPDTEAAVEETEGEPIEKVVQEAVESYKFTLDDVDAVIGTLSGMVRQADASIVTVRAIHQGVDWFDNLFETEGSFAGAIIAQTDAEFLIMTVQAAVDEADSIKVAFSNGEEAEARIKQQDTISQIAIVSVLKDDISENLAQNTEPLVLGNSFLVKEGDLLAGIGAPVGMVHSSSYGFVSAVRTNMQMIDRSGRILYSNILADASRGTFFLNLSGELIGWALPYQDEESDTSMTHIMCISDYKGILEDLSNGLAAPCLGIEGQAVTDVMKENGMPAGIYVMNVLSDRPVYNAGIQNGDIITKIDDLDITTAAEFKNVMDGLNCGQLIHVTVRRNGLEGYAELEFSVTVGAR